MKSVESIRTMLGSFIYYEPYVLLENISIPTVWMENEQNNNGLTNEVPKRIKLKTKETEELTNEKPNYKKLKTKETKSEIPKLILSKNGDTFKSKLKYSKSLKKSHHKTPLDRLNTKNEVKPSNNEKCLILNDDKKEENKEIKESVTPNNSLFGKIKVRNVSTINANYSEIKNFDIEKSGVSQTNAPFVFPPLGTKELTLLYFEQLHKKYFNKSVQDTLVINNNILLMNMLTNMHCISQVNLILSWKDKHFMAQEVHKLSVLYINYFEKFDKYLQTNIVDLISIFDDSDYEHGFLMIILSLYVGLRMLSSNVFQKSNVLLTKLKKLQWEVIKDKNVDHNKIQTTLESDSFCSCYYKISELIGEGSHTDSKIHECWKLFFIPAVLKITYFHSVTEAIINATDVDKLEGLLEEASNKVRQNSFSISDTKTKNLALVNKSTQKNINSGNDMTQPSTSGLTAIENTSMSIQSVNTSHIVHTESLRIKKPNMAMPNCKSKVCDVQNTLTNVPENSKDWFNKPIPVQSQNISTCTKTSESFDFKTHFEDYSNTQLTNIPSLSIADRVKLRKTRNTITAMSIKSEDSPKKLRSIKSEYIYTPSVVHTRTTRSSKLNMNCDGPPKKRLKKIHAPNRVNVYETNDTATSVQSKPNEMLKVPFSIKNENSSIPQIFYTRISEQNELYNNSQLLTNISTTSILKQEKDSEVRNCSSKVSTNICLRKKENSKVVTVNAQHGYNKKILIPKEPSDISKTSSKYNNEFNDA